ncbi:MAG: hypothetical protein A2W90_23140 [Bacteroidetes bacterium GWF2_42_66]|nr:MAG: hypothetical protein A2W92_02955 [Bacteroidetes bacterium GWA2_42_15]OFX99502.1 MAG: hypothetical protein A2W89_12825 [Bacteroidetes bacterium GWE2_42_39]OFY47033.1 MAG: hypothetical protein A2W90_23140 [Bacteroidetes bacterium GWF2_42_66]HAZ04298.1 hypothetical protein [Marinilabiliales bacterium]HBL76808.1 hypothetical protein [Prolixibacteraceae bacterium]
MKKILISSFLLLVIIVLLAGCATQSVTNLQDPPGFWHGLLHGFIILFSFIISLFTDYEIYAFPNTGGWYNFGFLLGVMIFFGGGGAGAKCRK